MVLNRHSIVIKVLITEMEKPVLHLRTNAGGEYVNKNLQAFFKEKGIIYELSPPYSHESNEVPERFNRIIVTMKRAMLLGHPVYLWSEAIATSVYHKNRLPHKLLQKKSTSYEAFHGNQPTIKHLQPFGRMLHSRTRGKAPLWLKVSPQSS